MNVETGEYRIRPSGRHILTIGKDLIQDGYAAVMELVKNAYDADSPSVKIDFREIQKTGGYVITISDSGHGMTRDTVINKWMVPSTPDKQNRGISPGGRIMQGRKGIGRYAASILGNDLLLETITPSGDMTTVYLEWDDFEKAEYLDDVEILIETKETNRPNGTSLTISGDKEFLAEWTDEQFMNLRRELKKLKSPIRIDANNRRSIDEFTINLSFHGILGVEDIDEEIEPYPLFDLFDYRIHGMINSNGKGILTYSQQNARNTIEEKIAMDAGDTGCGTLQFDIRVYDRDKEAIDSLIRRGLTDDTGDYVGKLEARKLLNEYNGLGVYRNGFRIRPYGDPGFDWTELDKQRVQNPSRKIGSDQVIGYVVVQSEEESGLIEKSARDGIKNNSAFFQLRNMTEIVISKLEEKRFLYRQLAGISRPALKIEKEFEKLFSFDELKKGIKKRLAKSGLDKNTTDEIIRIIDREEEDKNKTADNIRHTVAIYQGQATLGKIINVVLHEGRRPLSYFRNQIPNLHYWYESYTKKSDPKTLGNVIPIVDGIADNAEVLVKLFGRLDPLAMGKRGVKKPVDLVNSIRSMIGIFEQEISKQRVEIVVLGPEKFYYYAWIQDLYAVFTNLIDNSLYWMQAKNIPLRRITIEISVVDGILDYIDYRDTGPGIEPDLIESGVIFEPQFSTKPSGTGLGLAIAGEAAERNGLELKAFASGEGAWFRLQLKSEGGI